MIDMDESDIAIAHKDYDVRGGGEIVAEGLAETFEAPLYIGGRETAADPDQDTRAFMSSRVKRLTDRDGILRSIGHLAGWALQAGDLAEYDTVITSGNEPLWYRPPDTQTLVAYCHSPPRWQYDRFHDHGDTLGDTIAQATNFAQSVIYEHTANWPDLWVANSELVARRLERYRGVDADDICVVYPPIETDYYSRRDAPTRDYYITVSRLDAAKRIEEVVHTFNQLGDDYQLVVAGDGPERERLERIAGPSVTFEGYVPEARKHQLLASAKAFVFNAANEDFGMAPVEAMAAGTPVVGVDDGFTSYQVLDGENGRLFSEGSVETGIRRFESAGVSWSEEEIESFADRFSAMQFREGMRDAVADAERRSEVSVPWA